MTLPIKSNMLKRLSSVSHHSQLVLYDYDPVAGMAFPAMPESITGDYPDSWSNWMPYTFASCIPVNVAINLGIKTTGLYKVSVPLSFQFCYRYFYGLDLDYQAAAVETAKGFRSDRGNAKYLVVLRVAHGGSDFAEDIDFSGDMYTGIS